MGEERSGLGRSHAVVAPGRRVDLELERLLPSVPLRGSDLVPRCHRLNRCLVRTRVASHRTARPGGGVGTGSPCAAPSSGAPTGARSRPGSRPSPRRAARRRHGRPGSRPGRAASPRAAPGRRFPPCDGRGTDHDQRTRERSAGRRGRRRRPAAWIQCLGWMTSRARRAGSLACASASYLMVPTRRSSYRRVLTAYIKFCTSLLKMIYGNTF
jgi:hypothetical protein